MGAALGSFTVGSVSSQSSHEREAPDSFPFRHALLLPASCQSQDLKIRLVPGSPCSIPSLTKRHSFSPSRIPQGIPSIRSLCKFKFQRVFPPNPHPLLLDGPSPTRPSLVKFNEISFLQICPNSRGNNSFFGSLLLPLGLVAVPRVSHYALHLSPRHRTFLCCGHCCSVNLPAGDFSSSSSSLHFVLYSPLS